MALVKFRLQLSAGIQSHNLQEKTEMNDVSAQTESRPLDTSSVLPITRVMAKVCYVLFIAGCFLPPLALVAVGLNLSRRSRARGTWLESHFRRQLSAFLIGAAIIVVVLLSAFLLLGVAYASPALGENMLLVPTAAILSAVIFFLLRMFRGLGALNRNEAV
jgi:uncharacterized membrane protein